MKTIKLGRTGLEVTELCFGALPMGPLQKNLDDETAAALVARALELGINFIDTALMYKTYEPIRLAIQKTGIRPVVSDKSHMTTYEDMEKSILNSLEKMGLDYIDIYLLHAARAQRNVLGEREGAFRCLMDYREKGILKNIGISSHAVDIINLAADNRELDVVFPILNKTGMGILRGSVFDMENAIERCFEQNKGVYLMKALAGGNLIDDFKNAVEYVRDFAKERAALVFGMVNISEVDMNVRYFNGEDVGGEIEAANKPRKVVIVYRDICKSCGKCIQNCHSSAIELRDGKAYVNDAVCLKCGYCAADCPEFAIRIV